ncbi:sporulation delaying protein family toxin [Kitasatospora sp. NPDC008050]|uniref:sporulation delaying protein family toxin n=1 Tax=Kitasatospora sp. NPDC008050 TaxID=3364021 RepID=UPI0036EFB66A
MNLKTRSLICATLAAGLIGGLGTSAMAATPGSAPAAPAAKATGSYSDGEVLSLLLFAGGRAATEHPALAEKIKNVHSALAPMSDAQVTELTQQLTAVDPAYHGEVTQAVQAKDPFVVQAGMERLNDDLKTVISNAGASTARNNAAVRPNGFVWHDANVFTEINGVAAINVLGYANVAGATEVAVALVVVPDAVSYGFDMKQSNTLDEDGLVAAVAAAL